MSKDDTISLKEHINMKFSEFSEKMKEVHELVSHGLDETNAIKSRVTLLESESSEFKKNLSDISAILKSHDKLLVMDETRQQEQVKEQEKKTTNYKWAIGVFLTIGIPTLGYFGWLYIEHIKSDVIAQTSDKVITLIENKYSPAIK